MTVMRQIMKKTAVVLIVNSLWGTSVKSFADQLTPLENAKRLTEVEEVAQRLSGAKDSSMHALMDREYFDVRVTHCEVSVPDAPTFLQPSKFLYVEQAVSLSLNFPYRQRVVKLSPDQRFSSGVVSSIFESKEAPGALVGLCSKPLSDRVISWTTLVDSQCSVYLSKKADLWVGKTQPGKCPNNYNDASFVSSEVRLSKDGMYSWDQGWDYEGNQVWGAVKGGYRFKNIDPTVTDTFRNAVAIRLSGRFDTSRQAEQDPENFKTINYHNCLIDVPQLSSQPGAPILLIDQSAKTENLNFSRVKFLAIERSEDGQRIKATYYAIKNPELYRGQCASSRASQTVLGGSIDDVVKAECSLYFVREGRDFVGETPEEGCRSDYRGAEKLTVKARLSQYGLEVLEQWFDKDGKIVAGSKKGPYIYELLD